MTFVFPENQTQTHTGSVPGANGVLVNQRLGLRTAANLGWSPTPAEGFLQAGSAVTRSSHTDAAGIIPMTQQEMHSRSGLFHASETKDTLKYRVTEDDLWNSYHVPALL
ncbi:hypothetical protein AV530_016408 [Patagioenas fasciata monilis]|uniref:Uncharacterized protein n=1 Tax=Patagioenas fasciata monilis TaxID=372326 RepID=A0A1V4JTJ8_PATFA|nr:hypothetical protein AV530_016408 [Patagioenas fasciata monilis]